MKLIEYLQVTQPNQRQLIKLKSVQSFRGIFRTQLKNSCTLSCKKKLQHGCSTGFSIPTRLKLTINTSEEHHLCCPCAFIVGFEQFFSLVFRHIQHISQIYVSIVWNKQTTSWKGFEN